MDFGLGLDNNAGALVRVVRNSPCVHVLLCWVFGQVTEIDGLSLWLVTSETCQKVNTDTSAAMR